MYIQRLSKLLDALVEINNWTQQSALDLDMMMAGLDVVEVESESKMTC